MADKFDTFLAVSTDALRAEDATIDRLTAKAEKYIITVGVILGFHILDLKDLTFTGKPLRVAFCTGDVVGLALLFAALAMSLRGLRVREYPTFPVSKQIQLLVVESNDDTAKRSAAELYLRVRDLTLAVNEKRVVVIRCAGILLTTGLLVVVVGQLGLVLGIR